MLQHSGIPRRTAIQVGGIGLLGLGMNHVAGLRAMAKPDASATRDASPKSVIYIFLSGGLAQHESFDPKPLAPDNIRGEFSPIGTQTPGVHVSEHLPMLAARSNKWALVRSLTHPYNEHSIGHHVMLTGRTPVPRGFSGNEPRPSDFPCIGSVVNGVMPRRNNLPPAASCRRNWCTSPGASSPDSSRGRWASIMTRG
ncbi:MAG: DUF1501 domain-containing protein [Planctomycetales bacterium]